MQSDRGAAPHDRHIGIPTRLIVLLLCIIALYLRVPERFFNPQFWAEDGVLFFVQAEERGAATLFASYSNALYTFQRLVALVATLFPLDYSPAIYMAAAWAAFFTITLWCVSDRLPFSRITKILLALCVSYAAVKNETYLNLSNSVWIFSGCGLVLLMMNRLPQTRGQKAFDYGMCLLLGLSGPIAVVYSPLFVLKAAVERDRHSMYLMALILFCCLLQSNISGRISASDGTFSQTLPELLSILDYRFLWMFSGYELFPFSKLDFWSAAAIFAGIVVFLATVIWLAFRDGSIDRTIPLMACALTVVAVVIPYREMPWYLTNSTRYFFLPIVMCLWGLVLVAEKRPLSFLPLVFCSFAAFLSHPWWDEYAMPDLNWKGYAACTRLRTDCETPIHPLGFGLKVSLPKSGTTVTRPTASAQ